jgi:hypothetical protein
MAGSNQCDSATFDDWLKALNPLGQAAKRALGTIPRKYRELIALGVATLKRFADLTAEARPSTPQELADMLDKEDKLVVPMIKKLGIKAE